MNIIMGTSLIKELATHDVANLRQLGNSIGGACLQEKPYLLPKLKEYGINTVIDFRNIGESSYRRYCEESGLKYINFPVGHTRNGLCGANAINIKSDVNDKYIAKLKEFINAFNDENVYMGCHYGIDRTNLALTLNYLLNPKAIAPELLTWGNYRLKSVINRTLKVARKIIKNMSPEQKEQFNLTEDYNNLFQAKIRNMLKANL